MNRRNWATIAAIVNRSKNELIRVPGAAIPGVLAPTIFFLGLNGVFGALTQLKGFSTGTYESYIVPVSMLQGAGFTGAAASTAAGAAGAAAARSAGAAPHAASSATAAPATTTPWMDFAFIMIPLTLAGAHRARAMSRRTRGSR